MQIEFVVPGEPFGKQRPRHSRVSGTTYTPRETKLHEQLIQWAYRRAGGHKVPARISLTRIQKNDGQEVTPMNTKAYERYRIDRNVYNELNWLCHQYYDMRREIADCYGILGV